MRKRVLLIALFSLCAFAQTTLDGISTSASKTVTLWPDNAVFTVDVASAPETTAAQAAAWIAGTGITQTNLVGAGTTQEMNYNTGTAITRMVHEFQITTPYAKITDMTEKLRAAAKAIADAGNRLDYGMSLTASDDAVQLARQRVLPDLIAELKRRADTLAAASGLFVGSIQSIADNSYVSGAIASRWVSSSGFIMGSSSSASAGGLQATFSVSAKFGILKSGL